MFKRYILITGLSIFILGCGSVAVDRSIVKETETLEKPSENLEPRSVTNVRFSDIKIDEVTLSWSTAVDTDGYIEEYYISYKSENRDWSSELGIKALTLTVDNLASFTDYDFRIRSVDNEGLTSQFTYASMSTDLTNDIITEQENSIIPPVLYTRSNVNYIYINDDSKENNINIDDSKCWEEMEIYSLLECTDISDNIENFEEIREFNINFNQDINTIEDNKLQIIINAILNITGIYKYVIIQD